RLVQPGHGHRAGEAHEGGDAVGVDRHHPVDLAAAGLGVQLGGDGGHGGEVGREGDVAPVVLGVEGRVPAEEVGGARDGAAAAEGVVELGDAAELDHVEGA